MTESELAAAGAALWAEHETAQLRLAALTVRYVEALRGGAQPLATVRELCRDWQEAQQEAFQLWELLSRYTRHERERAELVAAILKHKGHPC